MPHKAFQGKILILTPTILESNLCGKENVHQVGLGKAFNAPTWLAPDR